MMTLLRWILRRLGIVLELEELEAPARGFVFGSGQVRLFWGRTVWTLSKERP